MELNAYMQRGIGKMAGAATRFYLGSAKGAAFMARTAANIRSAGKKRDSYEEQGIHVPPFLIASIAGECNLTCAGCYARAGGCCDGDREQMTPADWDRVFTEAEELGVSFVLLAGGEPLMRRDIVELAVGHDKLIFPVFTNGTLLKGDYLALFDRCRNLIPVISIEGDDARTDARRGQGVAELTHRAMAELRERGILFGVSITVTRQNQAEVLRQAYIDELKDRGCGLAVYVEYVPAEEGTEDLVLTEDEVQSFQQALYAREADRANRSMVLVSFPGDEQHMGGCLAAGRGFFHIDASGSAEPCPFSPFSDQNLREHTLLEVIHSDFFQAVREITAEEEHDGGCTLFQHRDRVLAALQQHSIDSCTAPCSGKSE